LEPDIRSELARRDASCTASCNCAIRWKWCLSEVGGGGVGFADWRRRNENMVMMDIFRNCCARCFCVIWPGEICRKPVTQKKNERKETEIAKLPKK